MDTMSTTIQNLHQKLLSVQQKITNSSHKANAKEKEKLLMMALEELTNAKTLSLGVRQWGVYTSKKGFDDLHARRQNTIIARLAELGALTNIKLHEKLKNAIISLEMAKTGGGDATNMKRRLNNAYTSLKNSSLLARLPAMMYGTKYKSINDFKRVRNAILENTKTLANIQGARSSFIKAEIKVRNHDFNSAKRHLQNATKFIEASMQSSKQNDFKKDKNNILNKVIKLYTKINNAIARHPLFQPNIKPGNLKKLLLLYTHYNKIRGRIGRDLTENEKETSTALFTKALTTKNNIRKNIPKTSLYGFSSRVNQ